MVRLRAVVASGSVVLLTVACGASQPSSPDHPRTDDAGAGDGRTGNAGDARPGEMRPGDVCPVTIAPSTAACPKQTVPPGNGSGGGACRSDADCKSPSGTDGRCIKNPGFGAIDPSPRQNLLAEPPPPPSPSVCVFDYCHTDADCGERAKCVCGAGRGNDRNHCVPLDACRADRDCRAENICLCGTRGNANYCVEGNCHKDADCADGFTCGDQHCHSKADTCRTNADCPPTSAGPRTCSWWRDSRRFDCHVIPPIPPG